MVLVMLDDVVVIFKLLQLFLSRPEFLVRFPFIRSFTA